MSDDQTNCLRCPKCDAELDLAALETRLDQITERLAIILQMVAAGNVAGGALAGRSEPRSDERAREFAALVNAHDVANGPLRESLRAAGYELIELPETIYGALTPETR